MSDPRQEPPGTVSAQSGEERIEPGIRTPPNPGKIPPPRLPPKPEPDEKRPPGDGAGKDEPDSGSRAPRD